MAALLRSARLLKSSPVSLLQIAGANIHGSALSRLYSGAVVGRGVGFRPTQASFSLGVNRFTWPLAAVRHFGVAPKQEGVSKDEGGSLVRNKQAQQFDWALMRLDNSVRRTGRITKTLLMSIFHDSCRTGYPSGNQALLLLRSCGSLLAELPLSERTDIAHRIWDKLQELGVSYDVSHYNALLKVYLQNEFKFSPTDFLAKMEAANILPNRVTYQRLIAAFCQEGDIEGASKILGFMKSKDLPITEAVFNSLIAGHARAGDMQSAQNVLSVMRGAGIEPGPDSYMALLSAYAEKGDMDQIRELLEAMEKGDVSLMDRDFMQLVFTLAKAGHSQHVPEILGHMRHERGYVPDAMNLCLRLITQGLEDTAFTFLKTFPTMPVENRERESPGLGNFFLRHCIDTDKPIEKIRQYCRELQDAKLHCWALQFTLQCALEAKKAGMAMELMKVMKEEGLPIRPHYFWPLLSQYQKDKDTQGAVEVLKNMQDLEVLADLDTYYTYFLPCFSSLDSASSALKEAGCAVDTESFIAAQLRAEAVKGNLAEVHALLSSPSVPPIDLIAFRGSLILAFKASKDVDSMAKITELLFRDPRYCRESSNPAENVSFFLYNLVEALSVSEIQAQEEKLRQYFHQLKSMGITIPVRFYRGIRSQLTSSHVPELIKDVIALVDNKEVLGSDMPRIVGERVPFLEKKLQEVKAAGEPVGPVLKQLIVSLCAEENLSRALELKMEHEADMAVEGYAVLINLCCRHDNVEEALNLKRELSRKDSSVALDTSKYQALVKVLSKHGKLEEAIDILKEMKEKEVKLNDGNMVMFFHLLNGAALRGDQVAVQRLQEAIFSLGLAKPSTSLCSPLVTIHLEKGDHVGALDAVLACVKQYGLLPRLHDVLCGLVEKGETELLQKAMDVVSTEWGERTMLYDLFFAFLQTGKYREARKIIETPGLSARPGRLQWFAEKCILNNQMEALENLVEMTEKLFECDRDDMYHYVLRMCSENNDWRKAEATWTKMQEENVIPRERTLLLLASILRNNGQEVPFEVPEVWYEEAAAALQKPSQEPKVRTPASPAVSVETASEYQQRLLTLCKKSKPKEAYTVLKEAEKKNFALGSASYDSLIKALLAEGNLKDAMIVRDIAVSRISSFHLSELAHSLMIITQVKSGQVKDAQATLMETLQAGQVPTQLSMTRLVQGLGAAGDAEGIQEVESAIKAMCSSLNLSRMLFVNNLALAHIKRGNIEAAVEGLESLYTSGGEPNEESPQITSISYVFRRLLTENNQDALDRLSAMAERLANHFSCYRPASDLFLEYVDSGRADEAKFLLQRCAGIAEQKRIMVSYITRLAKRPGQANKIKSLQELIPDFTEKDVYYPYLIKCYGLDNDLPSAKAVFQKMQEEGVSADELTLKRLAQMYKKADEAVPFPEPPESFSFYAQKLKQKSKEQSPAEEA
ncbi:leucine-rich PPR motif-containing protein, mitochondrial [Anguilla rostrata]|uniref:leucine-rich PPR motif-containing protein, mitochondrial n=1 Tax=Anguilla rostrata TaxID=7938 RepID=UPI0030D5A3AA